MNIYQKLKELNLPIGQYVVVGGAMEAHGIRKSNDLDILVTPKLYQQLLDSGYEQCRCEKCVRTSRLMLNKDNVDILPNFMFGNYIGDTRYLIESADLIIGFPFIKLEEFIKFKRELGREKDFDDIKLMEVYLKNNSK